MKFLVFSDLHGSMPAARLAMELILRVKPTAILLLGDTLYHGPNNPIPEEYSPKGLVELFAPYNNLFIAVQGNCDSEADLSLLGFPVASDFTWIVTGGMRIFATHGHLYSPKKLPALAEGDIFLHGHTHIPMARTQNGIHICNPGSLTHPKDDHPATYALFENGTYSVITKEGEVYLHLECV